MQYPQQKPILAGLSVEAFFVLLEELLERKISEALATLPAPEATAPKVMTIDDLSQYARVSKDHIYRLTSAGLIPHSKKGKRLFFDRREIDAWLLSNSVTPERIRARAARYAASKAQAR